MSKKYFDENEKYSLEFDENGVLKLDKENADFIGAILRIDSNYRKSFIVNENDENYSSASYISKHTEDFISNPTVLENICELIDKENSTHLSVSGNRKGNNTGIKDTAKKLADIDDLKNRLYNGESGLIDKIASVNGRNNFSFATKFCAYMCRNLFKGKPQSDNFVIYDGVIASILPYYAWKYTDQIFVEKGKKNINSTIEKRYRMSKKYYEYRELVKNILDEAAKEYSEPLTFEEFDNLVWYYYKGAKDDVRNALNLIPLK